MGYNPDTDTENNRFEGINEVLFGPSWSNRRIIDFMSGPDLLFFNNAASDINVNSYFVVDSDINNVNNVRITHPETNATYLDRWSPNTNQLGSLTPTWPYQDIPYQSDIIIIDSVFLNEPYSYMSNTINLSLFPLIMNGGMIWFNYYLLEQDIFENVLTLSGYSLTADMHTTALNIFNQAQNWLTIYITGSTIQFYKDSDTVPITPGQLGTQMYTLYNTTWLLSQWQPYADVSAKTYVPTVNNVNYSMAINKVTPSLP